LKSEGFAFPIPRLSEDVMTDRRCAPVYPALVLALAIASACEGPRPESAQEQPAPHPPVSSESRPLTISLQRTPCYGHCPWYTITIGSDGTVTYEGRNDVKTLGKRKSSITAEA
jgi:hypothetical protein